MVVIWKKWRVSIRNIWMGLFSKYFEKRRLLSKYLKKYALRARRATPEAAPGGFFPNIWETDPFFKIFGKKAHPYFPKWHLLARRSKLDNPFTSLLPVSEWPQEPYEIEFLTEQWSSMTFTNQKISCSAKSVWNGPGLVQHGPEPQNINILKCLWSLLWILSIFLTDSR